MCPIACSPNVIYVHGVQHRVPSVQEHVTRCPSGSRKCPIESSKCPTSDSLARDSSVVGCNSRAHVSNGGFRCVQSCTHGVQSHVSWCPIACPWTREPCA